MAKPDIDSPYPLTADQIARFRRDGYVKLKNVLSADVIEHYGPIITSEVYRLNTMHLPIEQRDTYSKAFLQVGNIWTKNEASPRSTPASPSGPSSMAAADAASTSVPPAAANVISAAGTHLFRRGVRALSPEVTAALAKSIAGLVRQRLATSGPCRTTEEFLAPNPLFGGRSLLEQAIADTAAPDGSRINGPPTVPEFSSQWLTQGDLMTMLAPILFPRSDSFVIRTYGDMANPVTGEPEGRAWAEACVQRMPDYVDAAQPPETAPAALNPTNRTYGRRFKLISFRWLAASDI